MGKEKVLETSKSIKKDFDTIKKLYGEGMAKYCRSHLSTIFEIPGKMPELLQKYFAPIKGLYEELEVQSNELDKLNLTIMAEFMEEYLSSQDFSGEIETPEELFAKAGYDFYECKTVEDMMRFEKYYAWGEKICTYNNPQGRLDSCHVFWAVKKDVDNIKRENFKHPERQDEYGTSVISIQFSKEHGNSLAIINRYNHAVNSNSNATFSNCLDNIIPGLTYSFEKHLGIKQEFEKHDLSFGGFVKAQDGRLYKFHTKTVNLYYCNNNMVIESEMQWDGDDNMIAHYYDKARYEVFDNYILDIKEKRIFQHKSSVPNDVKKDETLEGLRIQKCSVEAIKGTTDRLIKISAAGNIDIEIKVDGWGRMIEFSANGLEKVGDHFLANSRYIQKFSAPDLKVTGDWFLNNVRELKEIHIPLIEEMGSDCLVSPDISELEIPNLRKVGDSFLVVASSLEKFSAPSLEEAGRRFLGTCNKLTEFSAPLLTELKDGSLNHVPKLEVLDAPKIENIGQYCLGEVRYLKELNLPHLQSAGYSSLRWLDSLEKLNVPNLRTVGNDAFASAKMLEEANFPSLETVGMGFLYRAERLKRLSAPRLTILEENSLHKAGSLEECSLESIVETKNNALNECLSLKTISMPRLKKVGIGFLERNNIEEAIFPVLQNAQPSFMSHSHSLEKIIMPSMERLDRYSLHDVPKLRKIYMPNLRNMGPSCFELVDSVLEEITLTNLEAMEGNNFKRVSVIKPTLNLPNLEYIGPYCFNDVQVDKVELPKLIEAESCCFEKGYGKIERFRAPLLERVGSSFLRTVDVETLFAPSLKMMGVDSLKVSPIRNMSSWYLPGEVKVRLLEEQRRQQMPESVNAKEDFSRIDEIKNQKPGEEIFKQEDKIKGKFFQRVFNLKKKTNKEFVDEINQEIFQAELRNELNGTLNPPQRDKETISQLGNNNLNSERERGREQ